MPKKLLSIFVLTLFLVNQGHAIECLASCLSIKDNQVETNMNHDCCDKTDDSSDSKKEEKHNCNMNLCKLSSHDLGNVNFLVSETTIKPGDFHVDYMANINHIWPEHEVNYSPHNFYIDRIPITYSTPIYILVRHLLI